MSFIHVRRNMYNAEEASDPFPTSMTFFQNEHQLRNGKRSG